MLGESTTEQTQSQFDGDERQDTEGDSKQPESSGVAFF